MELGFLAFCSVSGFLAFPRKMLFAGAPRILSDLAMSMADRAVDD